jgi:hypothetical protein
MAKVMLILKALLQNLWLGAKAASSNYSCRDPEAAMREFSHVH